MRALAFLLVAFVFIAAIWRHRRSLGFGEQLDDFVADCLTWLRCWTWRKVVLQLGLYFIAIGQRLMEIGQRVSVTSEQKVRVSLAREWEKPVEMWRDEDQIMVMAGGRVVPFKR